MKNTAYTAFVAAGMSLALAASADASERKVKMSELPAPVQRAVQERSQGATVKGLTVEDENGVVVYEAELDVNGKTTDISFDKDGNVVSLEEETSLDRVPQAARTAIEKAAGKSKITLVETVTEKGAIFYEAHIKKFLHTSEVKVNANGERVP